MAKSDGGASASAANGQSKTVNGKGVSAKSARRVSGKKSAKTKASSGSSIRTLAIDVGGTGLKALILDGNGKALTERVRVPTPRPAHPDAVLEALLTLVKPLGKVDRISCGFPGVVVAGVVQTAPNLGTPQWHGYGLAQKLSQASGGIPARVLNDAGVQGFGVIEGKGTEMVLTLGTGMGCALFVDGRYVPNIELAHHPLKKGKSYEEWCGAHALEKFGKKKWNKHVREVLEQVQPIFNPRVIYLGGGNAHKLKGELPKNVKVTENVAGLLGGIALWRET
jgi:polyphosphate glucokinase